MAGNKKLELIDLDSASLFRDSPAPTEELSCCYRATLQKEMSHQVDT